MPPVKEGRDEGVAGASDTAGRLALRGLEVAKLVSSSLSEAVSVRKSSAIFDSSEFRRASIRSTTSLILS